jgi:hypothetical protein
MLTIQEEIRFNDPKVMKKYLYVQNKKNKQAKQRKWMAGEPEYDEVRARAMAENAAPGPGLRRGPEKQREYRPRKKEDEEEDASKPDPTNPLDKRPKASTPMDQDEAERKAEEETEAHKDDTQACQLNRLTVAHDQ